MTETEDSSKRLLERLLKKCVSDDASDVHLAPGLPPYFRIHGVLEPPASEVPLSAAEIESIAAQILAPRTLAELSPVGSLDGALTESGTRFRFNVFRRQGELAIAIRRLEDDFRTLEELGMPESLHELCEHSDGLVIVAGPTGAGKSTTLATLLHRINQRRHCHIVTIEDPIEYLHRPIKALVNQRQIGIDAGGFNDALVASMRQDPDVILVGEIRDLNTIRTAITAAETGHLVFTTVHAGDCAGTIERLVSVFPADEQTGVRRQISLVLRSIIAQHLLVADGAAAMRSAPQAVRRSRVVASEVLMVNSAVANLIANGKSAQIYSAMESGGAAGMQTLEQDLARLLGRELISERAAYALARNPNVLRDRVAAFRAGRGRPTARGRM